TIFVIVITCHLGADAASMQNRIAIPTTALELSRRKNHAVQPRNRTAKSAAASGTSIRKTSTASQIPKVRPVRTSPTRGFGIACSFRWVGQRAGWATGAIEARRRATSSTDVTISQSHQTKNGKKK